MNNPDIGNTKN